MTMATCDPTKLQGLTGITSFTEERQCSTCTSSICPGKRLISVGSREENEKIDEYPCFIKAYLLLSLSPEIVNNLLLSNNLIQYVGIKTQAVTRTTSRRGSYGNLGTLLIIIRDYTLNAQNYEDYSGIKFSDYLTYVRKIPGCSKQQNHAINHRLNEEFKKMFGREEAIPIVRIPIEGSAGTTYKINENLLDTSIKDLGSLDLSILLSDILYLYFYYREKGNKDIIEQCNKFMTEPIANELAIIKFMEENIRHQDARMFEISSFIILKAWYSMQKIMIGESPEKFKEVPLTLYKTGRVNANNGGIDYVLVPLGKYFQATQNFNFSKYFLDIEKLVKFPISFVIQTNMTAEESLKRICRDARKKYSDESILSSYLDSFDQIFTLRDLDEILNSLKELPKEVKSRHFKDMLNEFVIQYSVEYNIE